MPKSKTSPGADIRLFFKSTSPPTTKPASKSALKHYGRGGGKRKLDEDDDDFSSSGKSQQRNAKPTKMKKSKIIYDDSDTDEDVKPTTKSKKNENGAGSKSSKTKTQLPKASPTKTKPTTVSDFFGSTPVQRSSSKKPTEKRSQTSNGDRAKKPRLDIEEHADEDFQATLEDLDSKKDKKTGLASKLAAKVKSETRVPETPDHDKARASRRRSEQTVGETPTTGNKSQSRVGIKKELTPKKGSATTPSKPPPAKRGPRNTPTKTPPKGKTAVAAASPTVKKYPVTSPPKGKTETSPAQGDGEKRKGNPSYRSYLNRDGPRALGTRDEPEGAPGCLEGLTIVMTGVIECFDKDELKAMVEKYGGRVTGSVSKKTTHLVIGREPGEAKVNKAQNFGVKQIQEEDLYEMIETRPGKGGSKGKGQRLQKTAEVSKVKMEKKIVKEEPKQELKSASKSKSTTTKTEPSTSAKPPTSSSSNSKSSSSVLQASAAKVSVTISGQTEAGTEMWVDKYKPASTKQIIGQQGDRSNARKLVTWLLRWHDNNYGKNKTRAKNKDDGSMFRAALLSGPPGVGKTTTATLVCRETGFSYKEMNASDARNKKTLQGDMAEYLGSQSISDMFSKAGGSQGNQYQQHRHCLIMDEVDGVAGNQDRGGIQELIQMIKNTHVPIICICNDRSHPKIRSLVNYCFDLRFQRPRVPQIKAAMMSIAFKEKVSLPQAALDGMIMAANQDIRQVLHNLNMWTAGQKKMSADQMEEDAKNAKKDLKLGPWDVVRQVFSSKDLKTMNFNQKMDLFFHDYSISPLFVQENYLSVVPDKARGDIKKHLDLISKAADSMCQSDLVEKAIRSRSSWRLLPTQAVFASIVPGSVLKGYMGHMINFPSWLGKNSTRGKNFRLLQELQIHMRRSTGSSLQDLNRQYLPCLRRFLTDPLIERETDGVDETVQLMCDYDLLREDLDSLLEVTQYPGFKQPMSKVSTKVKSAFTRKYNQTLHHNPYSVEGGKKKKGRGGGAPPPGEEGDGLPGDEESATQNEEEGSDDDVSGFAVKKKASRATTESKAGSKGKGPAKGKAQAKGRKGKSK